MRQVRDGLQEYVDPPPESNGKAYERVVTMFRKATTDGVIVKKEDLKKFIRLLSSTIGDT